MGLDHILDLLRCPVCGRSLSRAGRSVRCPAGHSYDLARQGYLNLLGRAAPANADTAEMVAARDRFLASGAYAPLAEAVADQLTGDAIAEVGAGTGYYLAAAVERTGGRGVALDISPAACRRSARAHDRIGAVVADAWQRLPVGDGRLDGLLCVFAPRHPAEFLRVLRPGGVLVVAAPAADHLAELRAELGLLAIEEGKQQRLETGLTGPFTAAGRTDLRYRLELRPDQLRDLILMGPNAHHLAPGALDSVEARAATVAVVVTAWRRAG